MSVTILQHPDTLMPVYNDIVFTVDSTNKTQCAFRYLCDIYVEGIFVERLKLFPDSVTGYASFKVNRVLEDYVSYDLHNNLYGANIFSENVNTCKSYVLKFGEEYDPSAQCDAGTTVYSNLTNTSAYYTFNAALQYKEWLSWDSTDYIMSVSTSLFLTTIPSEALISLGSQMTFNFVNSGTARKLKALTYDSQNNLLGTYVYTNSYYVITGSVNKIITVGVGPENLNNSTLASGTQPVINSDVAYYTIQLLDNSNVPVSELKRLDIDYRITPFNKHRFWWLNRLGGFDSYDYNMKDKRKVDSSRTFYNKLYGSHRFGSPNGSWAYDVGDRGKTVLSVNAQANSVFNSNWLSEAESLWMEGLFTTLEVYLSDTNTIDSFCSIDYGIDEDNLFTLTMAVKQVYEAGDSVFIDFGIGKQFSYLSGTYTIESFLNGFIVINLGLNCVEQGSPPDCILTGTYAINGSVFVSNFNSTLDPVVIKSTSYEEKIKYRIKNIDYQIELEPSYSINTQRN